MDDKNQKVPRKNFLESSGENFRYENSGSINEFRLFHCLPDGTNRFSIYFGLPIKSGDNPFFRWVELANVDFYPQKFKVQVVIAEGNEVHASIEGITQGEKEISDKVCQVLNFHQISRSILPLG
ncbi:MAG: hypothetical protein KF800_12200 [Lysobacter sp.]|nr:hypothetical protein [Lysobacter sp.]